MLRATFLSILVSVVPLLGSGVVPECFPERIVSGEYPRTAQLARIDGEVKARVSVRSDGTVEKVTTDGHPILSKAVREAMIEWRFAPSCANPPRADVLQFHWLFKFFGTCRGLCKQKFTIDRTRMITVTSELPTVNP